MESSKQPNDFKDFLKVHNILSDTKISIPQVLEININSCTMILEDFGDNRFDKFINNPEYTSHLLKIAVDCLIVLKNSIS